jgi:hypothetical protein
MAVKGSVDGQKGDPGAKGATGAKGDPGAKGATGAKGAKGNEGTVSIPGSPYTVSNNTNSINSVNVYFFKI